MDGNPSRVHGPLHLASALVYTLLDHPKLIQDAVSPMSATISDSSGTED